MDQPGDPYRCCIPGCTSPAPRHLCRACWRRYCDLRTGRLPEWVLALQRDAQRQAIRDLRHAGDARYQPGGPRAGHPCAPRAGAPLAVLSLDELLAERDDTDKHPLWLSPYAAPDADDSRSVAEARDRAYLWFLWLRWWLAQLPDAPRRLPARGGTMSAAG